jgi:hypothetical protein
MKKINLLAITVVIFLQGCSSVDRYIIVTNNTSDEEQGILITPITPIKKVNSFGLVHLIDKQGLVLKEWKLDITPLNSKLDSRGFLFILGEKEKVEKTTNGIYRHFQIRDKQNKIIWSYFNKGLHHDFKILPNGNILFLVYSPQSPSLLKGKQKGKKLYKNKLWTEKIIEINPSTNEVTWEWESHKNIDLSKLRHISNRGDMFHANSIDYIDKFHSTGKPAIMMSARTTSTVYIIDKESKKVIWKSPKDLFLHQHDATFISSERILVFNNRDMSSEVIEYDLKGSKVAWKYSGAEQRFNQVQFYSSVISGAQRLRNGNTFITLGTRAFMLEVTPEKETVWAGFNSLNRTPKTSGWPFQSIFKAKQYPIKNSEE